MRFALVTLCLLICFGSAAIADDDPSVLFSDDFSTLDPGWGDANEMILVEGGKLVLKPKVGMSYTVLYQGGTFNDVDIRAKFTLADGMADEPAGIVFWASDLDNKYEALFQADGTFTVLRDEKGKFLNPIAWKTQEALKKGVGQVNELRVVTKGRTATFYINDTQVATIQGFTPEGGSEIGFHAESGDQQVYKWTISDLVRKPQ
jgi:hypothetical protein